MKDEVETEVEAYGEEEKEEEEAEKGEEEEIVDEEEEKVKSWKGEGWKVML